MFSALISASRRAKSCTHQRPAGATRKVRPCRLTRSAGGAALAFAAMSSMRRSAYGKERLGADHAYKSEAGLWPVAVLPGFERFGAGIMAGSLTVSARIESWPIAGGFTI